MSSESGRNAGMPPRTSLVTAALAEVLQNLPFYSFFSAGLVGQDHVLRPHLRTHVRCMTSATGITSSLKCQSHVHKQPSGLVPCLQHLFIRRRKEHAICGFQPSLPRCPGAEHSLKCKSWALQVDALTQQHAPVEDHHGLLVCEKNSLDFGALKLCTNQGVI